MLKVRVEFPKLGIAKSRNLEKIKQNIFALYRINPLAHKGPIFKEEIGNFLGVSIKINETIYCIYSILIAFTKTQENGILLLRILLVLLALLLPLRLVRDHGDSCNAPCPGYSKMSLDGLGHFMLPEKSSGYNPIPRSSPGGNDVSNPDGDDTLMASISPPPPSVVVDSDPPAKPRPPTCLPAC